ncbi:heavy-metal-associated domain-containing protein [Rhodocytophaga aerolata]|uniref:Heavy-metal-associated domain-containing protein n=1 Tax=Rhodocytophaga aerolata TaxID=455078 RepID=A0ABT8R4I2_9BACT|nr:heavy-metal-associated domain-containing protein [Rhodocytophaga aerolata]MDO1446591.1 heavy-metal-associated domain-containing protein [Rhodocytophaga aerolata]
METLKFKTNIKCGGCVAQVTPYLNSLEGIDKWEVDTNNPNKILSVSTTKVKADQIKDIVKKAGYVAETL